VLGGDVELLDDIIDADVSQSAEFVIGDRAS